MVVRCGQCREQVSARLDGEDDPALSEVVDALESRLTAVIAGAVVVALLGAVPAAAHVTVNPEEALKGDYEKLTFAQGEGEEPLTEAVRTITWTADSKADAIVPGEFDEFDISVGPLPENVDQMTFKAVQTYDSGEVVRGSRSQGSAARA